MNSEVQVSSDPARLDIALIHEFLSNSYWAKGRSVSVVERSIRNSLCFGAYSKGSQVGFARLITDRAVFAYLADVFVIPTFRGQGISKIMLEYLLMHRDIQGLRLIRLSTEDAHGLYEQYGFTRMTGSDNSMELFADEDDLSDG